MSLWKRILKFFGLYSPVEVEYDVEENRKAYNRLNKNTLTQELIKRGIKDFNKRQLKDELVDLLIKDDLNKLR